MKVNLRFKKRYLFFNNIFLYIWWDNFIIWHQQPMWRFGFSPVTLASHSGFIDQGFCKCRLSTSRNTTQNCYTDIQHFPSRNNIRKKLKRALCMLILIEHVECCIYVGDDWIMVISIIPVFNKLSILFFLSPCPVH